MTVLRRHFGQILDEVEKGQIFVITRRGSEVAMLVPAEVYSRLAEASE
ncbi:type II toxin-antitoxin system prevent-host-death family antitoxin [Mycolicibacterium gadium]